MKIKKDERNREPKQIKAGQIYGEWTVLNTEKNLRKYGYKILCRCNECGKDKYVKSYNLIKTENGCIQCVAKKMGKEARAVTHEEYIERLVRMGNIVKLKEGVVFHNTVDKITHICSVCKEDWEVAPHRVLSGSNMCLSCKNNKHESILAEVLKQYFKHIYPNTKVEHDIGFKGEKGRVSHYDIYIPDFNLIIECQSAYHDGKEEFDQKKKEFAIQKGYKFTALDSREYTPLQGLQYFFPHIKEIPHFIDLSKVKKARNRSTIEWSLADAQKLLDEGYSYQGVADQLGISYSAINGQIYSGKLKRSGRYKTLPIYQFSLNGDLINKYESVSMIKGISRAMLSIACRGENGEKKHESKGYLWYYAYNLPVNFATELAG